MGSLRLGKVTPETALPEAGTAPLDRGASGWVTVSVVEEGFVVLVCAPVMGRDDY